MKKFHILLVGFATPVISQLMLCVRDRLNYKISFIVSSKREVNSLLASGIPFGCIYCLSEYELNDPIRQDLNYLSSLEQEDVPTIHNMIMSDRVLKTRPYSEAIVYANSLSRKFQSLYRDIRPSVVIGGHDGMHSGIGYAVAKAEVIPWFALNFSTIPLGYVALSRRIFPNEMVCLREQKDDDLYNLAEKTLRDFENKQIKAPAYISAYNIKLIIQRLPEQLREALQLFKTTYCGELNKSLEFDLKLTVKQYFRKRKNILRFPQTWFLKEPPSEPYVFFGLHMQPESSIDVYAPFYSNQLDVVEKLARSIPPTHKLLVKLHISDADNYSRSQLKSFLRLPGVNLVAPNVSSREFIDGASAIVTISGTMGLEGALLGKPVLVFGQMNYENFPNVTCIGDLTNLPKLMKMKLAEKKPSRALILDAYKEYLRPYFRALHNDWSIDDRSNAGKDGFVEVFQSLEKYLEAQSGRLKEAGGACGGDGL